jgi:hypothetical protein
MVEYFQNVSARNILFVKTNYFYPLLWAITFGLLSTVNEFCDDDFAAF